MRFNLNDRAQCGNDPVAESPRGLKPAARFHCRFAQRDLVCTRLRCFWGASALGVLIALLPGCERGDAHTGPSRNDLAEVHDEHDHDEREDPNDPRPGRDLAADDDHDEHDGHIHPEPDQDVAAHDDHDHLADSDGEHSEDLIEVPPAVRANLGITFVKAERRPVRSTIRLPGQFEVRPEARREYHVMLPGRVDLAVEQYQSVAAGDVLFRLDSPEWRRVQSKLAEAFKACYCCLPELDVARAAKRENEARAAFLERRIANLAEADSRNMNLEAELAQLRTRTERLDAEIRAKEADRVSTQLAYTVLLNEAQSLTGVPRQALEEALPNSEDDSLPVPQWTTISEIVVRAEASGIVNQLGVTHQGWTETGDLVVETIDPQMIRFHADALQTDIGIFSEDMPARIVPPPGGSLHLQDTVDGTITVGFQAHADERTVPIYVTPQELPGWAKAGVTAYLEVFTNGHGHAVVAVPEAAVVRDGLDMVLFRRDPHDSDGVIRVVAGLGASDGRWVEVKHGVQEGDEIVLGGVYPLMLASSTTGEIQQAGHFHADGMFHEGGEH